MKVHTHSIRQMAKMIGTSPATIARIARKARADEVATGSAFVEVVAGADGKVYPADRESRITRANAIIEDILEHPTDSTRMIAERHQCSPATVLRYRNLLRSCSGVSFGTPEQQEVRP